LIAEKKMIPTGLLDLKSACHKLDQEKMSKEGVQAWYELSKLMPATAAVVVRKRISGQLANEQGMQKHAEELMLFEPFADELLTLSPDRITEGFKEARKTLGKPIMDEYIGDVAAHLKAISGVL
jgi:hypothetical protein